MRRTHRILTAATLLTLTALPLRAAIYMKIEGVKGRVTAAGKHEGWIELNSMQFMGDGSVRGVMQGTYGQLCSSGAPLPNVTFDKDGETHELRNVSFRDCEQVGTDTKVVFTYTVCNTHSADAPDHHLGGGSTPSARGHKMGGGAFLVPNAKLIGVGAVPVAIQLESLTLNGNTAKLTLVKAGTGTLVLNAKQKLPSLVVELATGQKWELENVMVTSWSTSASADRPIETLAVNFTKIEGPSAGFQARR